MLSGLKYANRISCNGVYSCLNVITTKQRIYNIQIYLKVVFPLLFSCSMLSIGLMFLALLVYSLYFSLRMRDKFSGLRDFRFPWRWPTRWHDVTLHDNIIWILQYGVFLNVKGILKGSEKRRSKIFCNFISMWIDLLFRFVSEVHKHCAWNTTDF